MQSKSDKIIGRGNIPFKLWLEFEETLDWEDFENDFANIGVDTLDGRFYGITVWTYKYFETVIKDKSNKLYISPPDLLVKELSRTCLEDVIIDILKEGNPEEILNPTVFNLNFIAPWIDWCEFDDQGQTFVDELLTEIHEEHYLHNVKFEFKAKHKHRNDIIIALEDGQYCVVTLTCSGVKEKGKYPLTEVFANSIELWKRKLKTK